MQTSHTPGPWVAKLSNNARVDDRITAANGATVVRGSIGYSPDAALIAAAPDLLAALQKLVRAIDRLPGNNPLDGLAYEARDAIARATGQ